MGSRIFSGNHADFVISGLEIMDSVMDVRNLFGERITGIFMPAPSKTAVEAAVLPFFIKRERIQGIFQLIAFAIMKPEA